MAKMKRDLRAHLRKTGGWTVGMCAFGLVPPQEGSTTPLKRMRIKRFRAHRNPKASLGLKGGAFVTNSATSSHGGYRLGLTYWRWGGLHIGVIGPVAPLRWHPRNILGRVFYVTGFAVDAVLRVDLKPDPLAVRDHLVDLRRAVTLSWLRIFGQVLGDRNARVGKPEMHRLVLGVVGA